MVAGRILQTDRKPSGGARIRPRDRIFALALGVGLHVCLLAALFLTGSGSLSHGAQMRLGEGEAVEVTLSGWEGVTGRQPREADTQTPQQAQLDRLVERRRIVSAPLYVATEPRTAPTGNVARLFDAPAAQGKGRQGEGQDAAGRRREAGARANTMLSSSVGDGANDSNAGSGLWRQIEPCWNRMPRSSAVPVTLEVSLNERGRLTKPPRILRPTLGRPDEQRLIAEARALQAISACLPYTDGQGFGRTHQVVFPGSRGR